MNTIKGLAIGLIILISACGSTFTPIEGKYYITIKVVSHVELRQYKKDNNIRSDAAAFAKWIDNWCWVYVTPDASHELLEHEIRHCIKGQFHD